ncbi:hypothetical protein [Mycobacterium paraintracellulare]|uniref:hypothetical protein n=1 Tax=Mycobacterium paraintracellulare TaxID=1138383 RepID=UPI001915D88F|nr:hypothetical protein [Mycobacterium paraintracellulare]
MFEQAAHPGLVERLRAQFLGDPHSMELLFEDGLPVAEADVLQLHQGHTKASQLLE